MEPFSSFVQHHEFSDVFLHPLPFKHKAEHHVEESSGKENRRGTCSSEAEVSMFLDSGISYGPGSQELRQNSVSGSTGKPVRDRVQNSATNFQEWQKGNNPFRRTGKLVRRGVCDRSGSTGKPVNRHARTRLDNHSMQISDNQYLEKVFKNVQQKLNRPERDQMLDQKVNVLI